MTMRGGLQTAAFALGLLLIAAAPIVADSPQLKVTGMTFVASRGERTELVVRAAHAEYFPDTDQAQLEEVHATAESKDGKRVLDLTCERGQLDLASNDFRAEGRVTGSTGSGRRFVAPWVEYDHEVGLLFTDAPVLITEGAVTFRGGGFLYYVRESRFVLKGGASVVQEP